MPLRLTKVLFSGLYKITLPSHIFSVGHTQAVHYEATATRSLPPQSNKWLMTPPLAWQPSPLVPISRSLDCCHNAHKQLYGCNSAKQVSKQSNHFQLVWLQSARYTLIKAQLHVDDISHSSSVFSTREMTVHVRTVRLELPTVCTTLALLVIIPWWSPLVLDTFHDRCLTTASVTGLPGSISKKVAFCPLLKYLDNQHKHGYKKLV